MRARLFSRRSIRPAAVLSIGSTKIKVLLACCVLFTVIAVSGRTASSILWRRQYAVSPSRSHLPRNGYTLLINTWKRNDLLKKSISHYASCPGLDSVHIVWSEPKPPPESLVSFLNQVLKSNAKDGREIELKFDINKEDSLNNRFKEIKDLKTDVVFSIDDDIIFPCVTVDFAFTVWQSAPDTMVGFVPRIHWVDQSKGEQNKYIYSGWWSVWWTGTYSMILSKAAFIHKKYLSMYTYEMPASIREYVTKNRNCEDIAMSFLVANASRAPPIWVKGSIFEIGSTGISSLGGHNDRRTHCVNWFAAQYRHMPLLSTSVKAVDSRHTWLWSIHPQSQYAISPFSIIQSSDLTLSISVADYGATGAGLQYDTIAIQSAIDDCSSAYALHHRPCQVTFPSGKYLTATLYLKSGVMLNVSKTATILGGTKLGDYPEKQEKWYVVVANDAAEVGITGGGEINGQGLEFVERFDERKNVMVSWNKTGACYGDECRPRLVGFIGCRNVRIWDVHFKQPAYWCLHIVRCQNTTVDSISINGDFNTPNNDGIDIEDSNNTLITRSVINTGDDAICPKTYTGPLYNLTATNCWIRTKSSAIKLGSASSYAFHGLMFDNITIFESHRGLGLQIRDGGNVSDVTFSNINISTRYYDESWWGRAEPIYITTCARDSRSTAGTISNLQFINITATSENGVFLSGSENGILKNLRFHNVNLTYKRWTNYTEGLVDYRPGCQGLVKRKTAGFMMEHIEGLEVENVDMRWAEGSTNQWNNPLDFRPSTVNNISIRNFYSGLYKK